MSSIDEKGLLNTQNRPNSRECTDIIPLLIFVLFWGGMVIIATFSIMHGDAFRLVYGHDSFGNTCDDDNTDRRIPNVSLSGLNLKGKPFVFFMEVESPASSLAICVNTCPDGELLNLEEVYQFSVRSGSYLCRYDVSIDRYMYSNSSQKGPCPLTPVKQSYPLLNRCVPTELSRLPQSISKVIIEFLNTNDVFHKLLTDLYKSWKEMFGLCFVAFGFSFIMILLIQYLASIIVWLILAVAVLSSIACTAFLWWTFADLNNKLDHDEHIQLPLLSIEIDSEKAFLTLSIISSILTALLLLVILFVRKRISVVVTLFHEAGKCVSTLPCLLLQPIWTSFILITFFVFWLIILAYLSTSEKVQVNENGFVTYADHETVSYFWWFHLIGLIWTSEFIITCQQLAVSGAVATWYFTRDKETLSCTISKSIGHMTMRHLGSVSLGAAVLVVVKLPRLLLMCMNKRLKGTDKSCTHYCRKCCTCCLWCFEKYLKYLNSNAYTIVAVSGNNFCSSSRKAFLILKRNVFRVAAIDSIGDFVFFLGKIGVMATTGAVGIIWFKSRRDLHCFAIPVLLCCVFAFYIAHCFISIFESVVDALLLCFCEDNDLNDGSVERPYFGRKPLMLYVSGSSKKINKLTVKYREVEAEQEPAQV